MSYVSSQRSRVATLVFAWVAVTALILTTACSKKNDAASAAPQTAAPAPAATPAAQPLQPSGELNGGSGAPAQEPPADPTTAPPQPGPSAAPGVPEGIIYYDPTGLTPEQIYSNGSRQAGSVLGKPSNMPDMNGQPLIYSTAGMDDLHHQIKAMLDANPNPEERAMNEEFASRVVLAKFDADLQGRTVAVTITVTNPRRQYHFAGSFDSQMRFRAGQLQGPYGTAGIELACMDLSGSCSTAHIKFMDRVEGQLKTAHVLARATGATLYTVGNGFGLARNPEADRLLAILLNTVGASGAPDTVTGLHLYTAETINGQSSFIVRMDVRIGWSGRQVLFWTGPLVRPAGTDTFSLPIQAMPSQVSAGSGAPIVNTIRAARLLRNDGRGNLQVELTVRAASPRSREEQLSLTISRIHKPVRPPFVQ